VCGRNQGPRRRRIIVAPTDQSRKEENRLDESEDAQRRQNPDGGGRAQERASAGPVAGPVATVLVKRLYSLAFQGFFLLSLYQERALAGFERLATVRGGSDRLFNASITSSPMMVHRRLALSSFPWEEL
jgi:hypothetical protein